LANYINVWEAYDEYGLPFNFFISTRGYGKTYGALKGCIERWNDRSKFIYMRRTQTEAENTYTPSMMPFKVINEDIGWKIQVRKSNKIGVFYDDDTKEVKGYACDLHTFNNVRGMDFSDVRYIVFDEFISKGFRFDEYQAFGDMYESVCRNRELKGEPPVVTFFLGNSITLDSSILHSLRLTEVIHLMREREEEVYVDEERLIYLWCGVDRKFVEEKGNTALYRLTAGTRFHDYALLNEFTTDYFGDVKKLDYKQYKPICSFEKMYFWEHKSDNHIYVSYRKGSCPAFDKNTISNFRREFGFYLRDQLSRNNIKYDNYDIKLEAQELLYYNVLGSKKLK